MPRLSSDELVAQARDAMNAAIDYLNERAFDRALTEARKAFQVARAQRSHRLLSEAWLLLLDIMSELPEGHTSEYADLAEGAYRWGETMPEEIQVWFFPRLDAHLEHIDDELLIRWSREWQERATAWLELGNMNVTTRLQEQQLKDVEAGARIDRRALRLERMGAFYADEMFDPEGKMLLRAAQLWREAGRPDRADFLEQVVAALGRRTV